MYPVTLVLLIPDLSFLWKHWIQISWLMTKPSNQDPQGFPLWGWPPLLVSTVRSAGVFSKLHTVSQMSTKLYWEWFNPCPAEKVYLFENTVDPDQLTSEKAVWSGSTLFYTVSPMSTKLHWEWLNPIPAEPEFTFLKTLSIRISWLLTKPSDQDPHCFPFRLTIQASSWIAAVQQGRLRGSIIHKIIQHDYR